MCVPVLSKTPTESNHVATLELPEPRPRSRSWQTHKGANRHAKVADNPAADLGQSVGSCGIDSQQKIREKRKQQHMHKEKTNSLLHTSIPTGVPKSCIFMFTLNGP